MQKLACRWVCNKWGGGTWDSTVQSQPQSTGNTCTAIGCVAGVQPYSPKVLLTGEWICLHATWFCIDIVCNTWRTGNTLLCTWEFAPASPWAPLGCLKPGRSGVGGDQWLQGVQCLKHQRCDCVSR
jgi:hypothetical protein